MRKTPIHTLILAALLLTLPCAQAAPRFVAVSFADANTAANMGVSWLDEPDGGDIVEYGLNPGKLDRSSLASRVEVPEIGLFRNATLSGLRPDTKYFYRVGGSPSGNWSATQSFWTAPTNLCEPIRFAVVGDSRGSGSEGSTRFREMLPRIHADGPGFLLNTGDLVMDGNRERDWVGFFETTEGFLGAIPLMPTMGNHDDGPGRGEAANFNRVLHLPRNDRDQTEDHYFFTYGPVAVAVLNSALIYANNNEAREQAAWLDRVLAAQPRPWRVVMLHHPIFTSQGPLGLGHPPNERSQNAALLPVLARRRVDVVFQGHVHWYERFQPSVGGSEPEHPRTAEDPATGTVFITTGGGGAPTSVCWIVLWPEQGSQVCIDEHHYTLVEIEGDRIRIRARAPAPDGGAANLDDVSWSKNGLRDAACARDADAAPE